MIDPAAVDPAPVNPAAVDPAAVDLRTALSPSRANDFQSCPLMFRFRSIDRLPEPRSPIAVRGTLVHAVLEDLFAEPAAERTLERARAMLPEVWERLCEREPELAELEPDEGVAPWLETALDLVDSYFALEDPRSIEPEATELRVDHQLASGLNLGGIIDRLDVAPDGRIRIVDFKTGRAPGERYEDKSLFQMKFYALVLWRTRGVIPTVLQLMYLADRTILTYEPTESDLLATERKVAALWDAIKSCVDRADFRPRKSALCAWCNHQDKCPEFGGTPPEFPAVQWV